MSTHCASTSSYHYLASLGLNFTDLTLVRKLVPKLFLKIERPTILITSLGKHNWNPNERQYSVLTHFTNVYLKHKIIIYKNTKLPTMPPPPTRTWDDQDHVRLLRKLKYLSFVIIISWCFPLINPCRSPNRRCVVNININYRYSLILYVYWHPCSGNSILTSGD